MLAVVVRGLSKHQSAFLFDCCVFYCEVHVVELLLLSENKDTTGKIVSVNKTPVDWYSKKQATVETATYGSEFVAAKTATEQIMDIRQTLRYLGAPIGSKSYFLVRTDL